jgi:hypothetical protein
MVMGSVRITIVAAAAGEAATGNAIAANAVVNRNAIPFARITGYPPLPLNAK